MICPRCGEETFARKKVIMDGWNVSGSLEVCALCGAELPQPENPEKKNSSPGEEKKSRLSALLGGEKTEKVVLAGSADQDFCRHCANFVAHPFKSICSLTEKEADPNGSCSVFQPLKRD